MLCYAWRQIVLLHFLLYVHIESLTFEVQNSLDSEWTFQEGSSATLVCTISPYSGVMTFIFNFTAVYACTASICNIVGSEQENFSFQSDTDNGIFTWTIHEVKMEFNGKQFECYDGFNTTKHTASVKGVSVGNSHKILFIVLLSVVISVSVVVIPLIISIIYFYNKRTCCKCCESCKCYTDKTDSPRQNSQSSRSSLHTEENNTAGINTAGIITEVINLAIDSTELENFTGSESNPDTDI